MIRALAILVGLAFAWTANAQIVTSPNPSVASMSDYSSGPWTPSDQSGAGMTLVTDSTTYVKIGKVCIIEGRIGFPAAGAANNVSVGGLPAVCTPAATANAVAGGTINFTNVGSNPTLLAVVSGTSFTLFTNGGVQLTNTNVLSKEFRLTLILITT